MKYKLGISLGLGYDVPFERKLEATAAAGFDACFTGWSDGANIKDQSARIRACGLIYQSIHAPFNKSDAVWEEGESGDEFINTLRRCLHDCAENEVPIMVVHPNIGMDRHSPTPLGIERFRKLINAAEKTNVKVAFENVEGTEYLEAVINELGSSPAVGYCWDTGHEMCYNFGRDIPSLYGDKLICTHLNDNFGMADPNVLTWHDDAHMMPFDGIADWNNIVHRLKRANYEDILTFELTCKSKPGKHTHDVYAELGLDGFLRLAHEKGARLAQMLEALG